MRGVVYILLPLSILLTVVLVSQGVIQNLDSYRPVAGSQLLLPMGPAASQIAIKQLGTNGGGFFNVNSAHPFENPTPAVELRRDAGPAPDSRGALLHIRPHGK